MTGNRIIFRWNAYNSRTGWNDSGSLWFSNGPSPVRTTVSLQSPGVASFTKEVKPRLTKRPSVFNGRLANRRLTSCAKESDRWLLGFTARGSLFHSQNISATGRATDRCGERITLFLFVLHSIYTYTSCLFRRRFYWHWSCTSIPQLSGWHHFYWRGLTLKKSN